MATTASDTEELLDWLSSTRADNGITHWLEQQLSVLDSDEAYQVFINAILSPSKNGSAIESLNVARSYRALACLKQDLQIASQGGTPLLINESRAGLLAKDIFASMEPSLKKKDTGVLVHKRALLDALLEAYPSAVISAAAAGGKDGLEEHLGPLMLFENCSQTLPTLTSLVVYGCTGQNRRTSTEHRPAASMPPVVSTTKHSTISQGHKRKFVRNLTDWNLLERLAWWIVEEEDSESPIGLGEEACETLLTIVECVGYPHPDDADEKETSLHPSVGEEMLLAPLGQSEYWEPLVQVLSDPETTNEMARVAAARAIVGLFGLATGKSPRIRRSAAPAMDATDDIEAKLEPEENEDEAMYNKMRDWGLTTKIHAALISHLSDIVKALTIDDKNGKMQEEDFQATIYIQSGEKDHDSIPPSAVPHPGRCYIVPFTSWRLQIVGLLAQLISYDGDNDNEKNPESESLRAAAMDALMKLPIPPQLQKKGAATDTPSNDSEATNPWPMLVDWVFQYPETTLYHVQFQKLFQAICLEHHEPTLRLVLQKCKFVSRAIRTCKAGGPLRGMLLMCLNSLRLRSQSLPPSAFMRQFLESHDAWKDFQDELQMLTLAQQRPVGGSSVPGQDRSSILSFGIDLGSRYAAQLGFEGLKPYEADSGPTPILIDAPPPPICSKKKKKKRRKKKDKQQTEGKQETETDVSETDVSETDEDDDDEEEELET